MGIEKFMFNILAKSCNVPYALRTLLSSTLSKTVVNKICVDTNHKDSHYRSVKFYCLIGVLTGEMKN